MGNRARAGTLPSALDHKDEIIERLQQGRPAIFLDYDGTLTPIVEDPDQAVLPERTRRLVQKLSDRWIVIIVSGRALDDVRNLVGLDNAIYVGSHGFGISGDGEAWGESPGEKFRPSLDRAETELRERVEDLDGVRVERKPFSVAVHFRRADASVEPELEKRIDRLAAGYDDLAKHGGKKIFELRPDTDWDKGKALLHLLDRLYIDGSRVVPLYIGDDVTDEDAFRAIVRRGVGILVGDDPDRETEAAYVVRDPDQTADFLEELVKLARKESGWNTWSLAYEGFDPGKEKLREALCTVGNGYFAVRGAAPESTAGQTHYPGTYVAGVYNRLKSAVDDHTIENESLVNVPNWLPLNFRIEHDDWFAVESVDLVEYHQELDLARGLLIRTMEIEDRQGRRTRVVQRRFAHMHHPHLGGLETTIRPRNWSGTIRIRSALDGKVENTLVERYQPLNNHHLTQLDRGADDHLIWLRVETNQSGIRIAEAARTEVFQNDQPVDPLRNLIDEPGYIGQEFDLHVERDDVVRVEKIVALYTSRDNAISESLLDAREAAGRADTFGGLLDRHKLAWDHLWKRWRIDLDADCPRIKQILNLHVFHLLQTVSPNTIDLDAGVPPRGLHGEAYRGLIMWDELFIFPLINLHIPDITKALIRYRHRRLAQACWAADRIDRDGAMFPWQSGSNGQEQAQTLHLNPQSGRWIPDNTQLERHINLAIAYNVWQYYQVTGDRDFLAFYGGEMMIKIARFWADKAEYNTDMRRYEIRGVMGPDEFHDAYPDVDRPGLDNNAYTNVLVAWLLWRTLDMLDMIPPTRKHFIMEDLAVEPDELDRWDEIGRNLRVPFHDGDIISQFEGYGDLMEFDWEGYREKYGDIQRLDRILESEHDTPNRYKVSKQADVLMLFYLFSAEELGQLFERLGYSFEYDTIPNNVRYYLERTSNGSTLSRVVHAWVMARLERAASWRLFQDALESDIEDIQGGTTQEGIHLGAMAGTVDLVLRCYSGLESRGDALWFNPRLPPELNSLRFSITYRKNWLDVDITENRITLANRPGPERPVDVSIKGERFSIAPGQTKHYSL